MDFNKTIQALVNYDSIFRTTVEAWKNTREEITSMPESAERTERLMTARDAFNAQIVKARANTLEAVKADFEAARAAVSEVVTKPIPADFAANVEVVKNMGSLLNMTELNIYMDKYADSYIATKTLARIALDAGFNKSIRYYVVDVDKIVNEILGWQNRALYEIQNRDTVTPSYEYRMLIHRTSPLKALAERVTRFVNGDFSDYETYADIDQSEREGVYNTFVPRFKSDNAGDNGNDNQ